MNTHITLTRKVGNKRLSVIVPIHSATFTEDMDGNVLLRTNDLTTHIEQSMQDIVALLEPIGFDNK